MPLTISFAKNSAAFLRSPHHCFGILRDTSVPSWKQWLWICRTQPQGWQSCVHPECAHEQLFVWYSSHVFFSSADVIIYQAEVLQIHCTTTGDSNLYYKTNFRYSSDLVATKHMASQRTSFLRSGIFCNSFVVIKPQINIRIQYTNAYSKGPKCKPSRRILHTKEDKSLRWRKYRCDR